MKDIDMRDETQLMRVSTRLMELGILTPQQGMEMFQNGKFPSAEDIAPAQDAFIKQRKDGYYNPIVGGVPMMEDRESAPQTNKTPKSAGRPEGTVDAAVSEGEYSRKDIQATVYEIEAFTSIARERVEEKFNTEELNKNQEDMLTQLCQSIVCSTAKGQWGQTLEACVEDFELIEDLNALDGVLSVASKHSLDIYPSAVLYHSHEN